MIDNITPESMRVFLKKQEFFDLRGISMLKSELYSWHEFEAAIESRLRQKSLVDLEAKELIDSEEATPELLSKSIRNLMKKVDSPVSTIKPVIFIPRCEGDSNDKILKVSQLHDLLEDLNPSIYMINSDDSRDMFVTFYGTNGNQTMWFFPLWIDAENSDGYFCFYNPQIVASSNRHYFYSKPFEAPVYCIQSVWKEDVEEVQHAS